MIANGSKIERDKKKEWKKKLTEEEEKEVKKKKKKKHESAAWYKGTRSSIGVKVLLALLKKWFLVTCKM